MTQIAEAHKNEKQILTRIFTALGALFGTALFLSFFLWKAGYATRLAIWFLFSLCAFHAIFSSFRRLTPYHTKLIDYPYLGAAALGLILATIHYAEQREAYLDQYNDLHFQYVERQHRDRLRLHLESYKKDVCERKSVSRLLALHCQFAGEVDRFASSDSSSERRGESASSIEAMVNAISQGENDRRSEIFEIFRALERSPDHEELAERLRHLRQSIAPSTYDQVVVSFKIVYEDVRRRAAELPARIRDRTFLDVALAIGVTALWPFIIVLALALRITKVTIEVRGWDATGSPGERKGRKRGA
jgi:hypothetical protein